jgi:proline iminopeptidase
MIFMNRGGGVFTSTGRPRFGKQAAPLRSPAVMPLADVSPARSPATLYADRPLLATHELPVEGGHVLHIAEWGSADGIAAVVMHGGPGSGGSSFLWRVFDPARFRVICVDQRGSGASRPAGAITNNSTADLIRDTETVRRYLAIDRWLVAGGSWGAALAIAYAAAHPDKVNALLLRSSFLARPTDVDAFFEGAHFDGLGPPAGAAFLAGLSDAMQSTNDEHVHHTAITWWRHEHSLLGDPTAAASAPEPTGAALVRCINRYRVQAHYLAHGCWLNDPPLLARCASLPRVPTLILHAPDDRVCPPEAGELLRAALPHAGFAWTEGAGHDPTHPAMVAATVSALDSYADHGRFEPAAETAEAT